uniref:DUF148 domain-containing protein n=1 Tax=Rhabditophanes sp. KR3021 TaxID=114890 RepID=A0AC35TJJ2_9BILA
MSASFKVLFVTIVFASLAYAQFGANGSGQDNTGSSFNFLDFLRTLSRSQADKYVAIIGNKSLTKGQILSQATAWATKEPSPVLENYKKYKTSENKVVAEWKAKTDAGSLNLTSEAKAVYDQMEKVKTNQDITSEEENRQVNAILNGTTPEIRKAIVSMFAKVAIGDSLDNLVPNINIPAINIPAINIPTINIPEVKIPAVNIPELNIPAINIPEFNLENFNPFVN